MAKRRQLSADRILVEESAELSAAGAGTSATNQRHIAFVLDQKCDGVMHDLPGSGAGPGFDRLEEAVFPQPGVDDIITPPVRS